MMAFKGFTPDLTSRLGDGIKKNCEFIPGETKRVENCKTTRSGFHCCEYPPDCLMHYGYRGNRFFRVEAAGNIDEDDGEKIAATEITLVEELDAKSFAKYTMLYMLNHQKRESWESSAFGVRVAKEKAEANESGHIAIARGKKARVKGVEGSVVGLLIENNKGEIVNCKLLVITSKYAKKWLTITEERKVRVLYEKEID